MIFHKYNELIDEKERKRDYKYIDDCDVFIEDEILDYQVRNLSCCIYDAKILKAVACRFIDAPGVDHILNLMVMEYLPARFVNKELSVYRVSDESVWISMPKDCQLLASINRRYEMNEFLNNKYKDAFDKTINDHLLWLSKCRKILS